MPHQVPQTLVLVVCTCEVVRPCRTKLSVRAVLELGDVLVHAVSGSGEFHYLVAR